MSMDPSKWIPYDQLSQHARERIEQGYPYLKLDNCVFQEKESGVFVKQVNNVKIEKLLDEERPHLQQRRQQPPPQQRPAARAGSGGRSRK